MSEVGVFDIEGSIELRDIDNEISHSVEVIDPQFYRVGVKWSDDPANVVEELEAVSGITNASYTGEAPEDSL